ncbi:MAG: hypothetical protein U0U70_11140 [Chitinophagaceae bacterium]
MKIKQGNSYEIDFTKGIYTVFFDTKPPLQIKFIITDSEKAVLQKKMDLLDFKKRESGFLISDSCYDKYPKIYTLLNFTTRGISRSIQIDLACTKYSIDNVNFANQVKEILLSAKKSVHSENEIPESDVTYW